MQEVGNYPVWGIARALKISVDVYDKLDSLDYPSTFEETAKEEVEITILGLIKSLRISAFNSSEKQ